MNKDRMDNEQIQDKKRKKDRLSKYRMNIVGMNNEQRQDQQ